MSRLSRRRLLKVSGLGVVGAAGCLDRGSDDEATTGGTSTGDAWTTDAAAADYCVEDASFGADDPLAVEYDARRRFRCRGRLLDDFESLADWDTYEGTLEPHDDAFEGAQSARLTASAGDSRGWMYRTFDSPVDLSDRTVSLAARLDAPQSERVIVQLLAPDRENQVVLSKGIWESGWTRLDFGPTVVKGDPDLTDVRELRIQLPVGKGTEGSVGIDALQAVQRTSRGAVMFTFDDNYRSQYDTAFPIMERHDVPGSVGVIHQVVGAESRIRLSEMRELQSAGWDMVSHPQLDRSFRQLSYDESVSAFRETKQWLVDHGFERGARFLIWPYGRYDAEALSAAARYHYLGFAGGGSPVGAQFTNPLVVSRVTGDEPDRTAAMVDLAERFGLLCVIRFHSVGVDGDGYVSEAEFRRIVEHVADADVDVLTPSDLWDRQTE